MKKLIQHSIIIFVVVVAVFCYAAFRAHARLDRHVSPGKDTPIEYSLPYEDRSFETSDGIKIASWYIPVKDAKAVVVLVHGFQNSDGGKSVMLPHAKYLNQAGYTTLLLDLRSVGYSQGDGVTLGVNEWKDVEAAYDYVKHLPENKNLKIGFLGNSMGAATTIIQRGITGKGDFIVASVPYADFKTLFDFQISREGLPPLIFYPVLKISSIPELGMHYSYYSPINWVDKIDVPIFFMSAAHDGEVDSRDAKILYDNTSAPKEYWEAQTGHDIYKEQPEKFRQKVLSFLAKIKT